MSSHLPPTDTAVYWSVLAKRPDGSIAGTPNLSEPEARNLQVRLRNLGPTFRRVWMQRQPCKFETA